MHGEDAGMSMSVSRILVVGEAVKQIRHHPHHGLQKAYFVAGFSTKDTKALPLHLLVPLALQLDSVLPCEIRLVPMIRGQGRGRVERRRLERRMYR